jgi:tryptophan synthase beta subunit
MGRTEILLVNLSGRGDKDVMSVQKVLDARQAADAPAAPAGGR